jgi:hypothetical protein
MSATLDDQPARIAVLERIAADTTAALQAIRTELHDGLREIRDVQRGDFRWLLGLVLGGIGVTISGFVGLLIAVLHH